MGKTIAAVVVGFIVWSVLHLGNMTAVQAIWQDSISEAGAFTETKVTVIVLVVTFFQSVASGFVCRLIARKGKAPIVLAAILTIVGTIIETSAWELAPSWYHIIFLVMLTPMTLLGAKLAPSKSE